MTSKAHAEFDPVMFGVRIAVRREHGPHREYLQWEPLTVVTVTEGGAVEPDDRTWLRLPEDDARALYEALADHFGHAGHDTRALRRDYDDERRRVDHLIAHMTGARP